MSLRTRLEANLRQHAGLREVATQLCIALAALMLQSDSPLALQSLGLNIPVEDKVLELLTIIPEEHQDGSYFTGDTARRARINGELYDVSRN